MTTFYELGLHHNILRAITNMGFEEATPIQEQTIPLALQGKDLIGQAQTGTGKTAAFGIPLIERIEKENLSVQALVLTPTRELAVQVAEELNRIGQFKGVRTLPIYGGQEIDRQIKALKKRPHIIVATPGRFMDHMRRATIRLHSIQMVVLDEADEMLNMGFIDDIETILEEIPKERQTLLFSATMPKPIQLLANKFMKNPEFISIKAKELTVPNIEQQYLEVNEKQKFDTLCRLLDIHAPELAIVFGRTKRRVDELTEALNKRGYSAEGIHGDLSQRKRDSVLRKFKEASIEILVATDVAARGLDISGVSHVFNFDIPQDPESYVHRIGRTGRAGKTGLAITFVTPREIPFLRTIEKVTKRKIIRKAIPTVTEAMEGQLRLTVEKLLEVIEQGKYFSYQEMAEKLLDEHDSLVLVSAALKMLTKEPDQTPVKLTEEEPLKVKKEKHEKHQVRAKVKTALSAKTSFQKRQSKNLKSSRVAAKK
ncbi:ATP-dependent RNA helicase DeaD [Tepidibacillus fermentans]|uniref:DEAD-box ATP-dependent RNA helicase CshA n=1 Tax=Tepidibacillus fermentans TaxID=1281767 RepID=A0A4V2USN3_9BACI|nr:ATP-dependent RNA helicase DeaD [Tepidibacillus fermentans]